MKFVELIETVDLGSSHNNKEPREIQELKEWIASVKGIMA